MNLILLFPDDFTAADRVRLTDRRHTHINSVLKATCGETLQVGLLNGQMGRGTVIGIDRERVELSVTLDENPPEAPEVTLLLALPRPKVLKRVLQGIAAMGIKQIYLLNTWRVDKSYWQSPLLQEDSLREQLLLGLEQGRDTCLPTVHQRRLFKPFVEDELPALVKETRALLADPRASIRCPADVPSPLLLAIGPEGGFIPYEIERLHACGLEGVHLGQRALRVETAVPALLGRLINR